MIARACEDLTVPLIYCVLQTMCEVETKEPCQRHGVFHARSSIVLCTWRHCHKPLEMIHHHSTCRARGSP